MKRKFLVFHSLTPASLEEELNRLSAHPDCTDFKIEKIIECAREAAFLTVVSWSPSDQVHQFDS